MLGKPECECGVLAVVDPTKANVVPQGSNGLRYLQNRGRHAAGVTALVREGMLKTVKGRGTVPEVLHSAAIANIEGSSAILHTRFATHGSDTVDAAQPFQSPDGTFAICFNGELANAGALREQLQQDSINLNTDSDTEVLMHLFERAIKRHGWNAEGDVAKAFEELETQIKGTFNTLVLRNNGDVYGYCNAQHQRPLWYGQDEEGRHVIASEDHALNKIDAKANQRELEGGELLHIEANGQIHAMQVVQEVRRSCVVEYFYIMRVLSTFNGLPCETARGNLGKQLALSEAEEYKEQFSNDDTVVVGVPDTGITAAEAYAKELGITYETRGIEIDPEYRRTHNSSRTYIAAHNDRKQLLRQKFNIIPQKVSGKNVVIIDDTIVHGLSMELLIELLYEAGAKQVHVRIPSPPITEPCFNGVDMRPDQGLFARQFMASGTSLVEDTLPKNTLKSMAQELGATSLRYLPVSRVAPALGVEQNQLCLGCINGQHPNTVPEYKFTEDGYELVEL